MGLGSTAKKIQGLSDRAEAMYKQVQELQQRITRLEEEVDDTHDTVKRMDHQLTGEANRHSSHDDFPHANSSHDDRPHTTETVRLHRSHANCRR